MSFDDLQGGKESWATPQGPAVVDGVADASAARDRAATLLQDSPTRPGWLSRRLMGLHSRPQDVQLADQLVRERRRRTRIDGSMNGSFFPTVWTAWELMDLGCQPDHSGVVRTIGWVLARQDRPGHYGEGCSDRRHARKLCRHFLKGFFAAGTRDEDVAPLTLPSGLVLTDEEEARFAASCFALRVVLRAREDRRSSVRQHVETLLDMHEFWERLGTDRSADLALLALGALCLAPIEYRHRVDELTDHVVLQQLPDGSWPNVHFFNALDTLLCASTRAAQYAVKRATPLLCSLQRENGAFDPSESEEITLIGLRALRVAEKK